jgi:hypothetical protein
VILLHRVPGAYTCKHKVSPAFKARKAYHFAAAGERRCLRCFSASDAAMPDQGGQGDSAAADPAAPKNFVQKLRNWIFGGPIDKERLRSLGLGAIISYGCASHALQCHICSSRHARSSAPAHVPPHWVMQHLEARQGPL